MYKIRGTNGAFFSKCLLAIISIAMGFAFMEVIACTAAGEVVFQFDETFNVKELESYDVIVDIRENNSLEITTVNGENKWPGITLKIPLGKSDMSGCSYLSTDIENTGADPITVYMRIDDYAGHKFTTSITLAAGEKDNWRIEPVRQDYTVQEETGPDLFAMQTKPYWAAKHSPGRDESAIDMKNIKQILIFVRRSQLHKQASFIIGSIMMAGGELNEIKSDTGRLLPFVDSFGQYKHADWPGKVVSAENLTQNRIAEMSQLAEDAGPLEWDAYGGWENGPQLEATGFFRTEQFQNKWYLVDPEGNLFFSIGAACINYEEYTPIDGRYSWFERLPEMNSEFSDCYSTSKPSYTGYYANKKTTGYNFYKANLKLKYGWDWEREFADAVNKRLPAWGMNTIGEWSAENIYNNRQLPYLKVLWHTSKMIKNNDNENLFYDVFDPSFISGLEKAMTKEMDYSAEDSYCIGYFVDNELKWGDEEFLARSSLASPGDQSAKMEFVKDLTIKYKTIQALNASWETDYESWEALLKDRITPGDTPGLKSDLREFNRKFIRKYFETCRDVIKKYAPHHLYMGSCFKSTNSELPPELAAIAQEYCDVISIHCYDFKPTASAWLNQISDKPIIISEFHFGTFERGGFGEGLVPVKDQQQQARAYKDYVTACLTNPRIIGCIWFKFEDQPATGRTSNGENFRIGLVDITDTPYTELVAASREIGEDMYKIRAAN